MYLRASTCQQWRIEALCGLVLFMKFTAASHSETNVDTSGTTQLWNGKLNGEKLYKDAITDQLSALPITRLQSLVEYYKNDDNKISEKEPEKNREAVIWMMLFRSLFKVLQKSLIDQVLSFILTKQKDYTCYKEFGCFSPENRMALDIGGPVSPEEAGVRFYFYSRRSPLGTLVTATNWSNVLHRSFVKNRKALKIVIHGFKESSNTKQVVNLTSTLLQHTRSNVIVVDWQHAARFPFYATAAANSPLVGAELSVLLQSMYNKSSLWPKTVHLIGFSLGAHAAGFCGRHFENATKQKIGRITGLDPAGLLFENPNASLSSADAEFVDVIHTNGGNMNELEFGRKDPMGHVDFYPNGGSYQWGCTAALSDISCSHNRAWWYFIEALQSTCSFKSIPCHDGWNYYLTCLMNTGVKSVQMGSRKVIPSVNGSYYLKTNPKPPYCIEDERFPR